MVSTVSSHPQRSHSQLAQVTCVASFRYPWALFGLLTGRDERSGAAGDARGRSHDGQVYGADLRAFVFRRYGFAGESLASRALVFQICFLPVTF